MENKINNMTKEEITEKAQEILNQLTNYTFEDIQNITYEIRQLTRNMKLLF